MYFGKPIPEWITEHRNDTITLGEIVDYCEKSARISDELRKRIADGGFSHDYDISAYAFFVREEREVKQAIDAAVDILGMRYGYPDDAPQDDENSDDDHIDEDIQAADMAAEDMEDNTEEEW